MPGFDDRLLLPGYLFAGSSLYGIGSKHWRIAAEVNQSPVYFFSYFELPALNWKYLEPAATPSHIKFPLRRRHPNLERPFLSCLCSDTLFLFGAYSTNFWLSAAVICGTAFGVLRLECRVRSLPHTHDACSWRNARHGRGGKYQDGHWSRCQAPIFLSWIDSPLSVL